MRKKEFAIYSLTSIQRLACGSESTLSKQGVEKVCTVGSNHNDGDIDLSDLSYSIQTKQCRVVKHGNYFKTVLYSREVRSKGVHQGFVRTSVSFHVVDCSLFTILLH